MAGGFPRHWLKDKGACLPCEQHSFGYSQRAHYRHPDRYDEEVLEMDASTECIVSAPAGVALATFLLLGDQNAGKSTFLHSFSWWHDPGFLQLTSYLPMLSSTFVNTRYTVPGAPLPRDEPPFLDTDIGRATIVLSIEDFAFFLDEFELPPAGPQLPVLLQSDTRYVALQMIEVMAIHHADSTGGAGLTAASQVGGDHLDALRAARAGDSGGDGSEPTVLARTAQILSGAQRTLYMINAAALFSDEAQMAAALEAMIERIQFVDLAVPDGHRVVVAVSRLPEEDVMNAEEASEMIQLVATLTGVLLTPVPTSRLQLLQLLLPALKETFQWKLEIGEVWPVHHLEAGTGYLEPMAVVDTVVRLIRAGAASQSMQQLGMTGLAAVQLLGCFKQLQARVYHSPSTSPAVEVWLTQQHFIDYLSEAQTCELPEASVAQHFEPAISRLCKAGLAIPWHAGYQADLTVKIRAERSAKPVAIWRCPSAKQEGCAGRFPYFSPLLDSVEFFLAKGLPAEWWLEGVDQDVVLDPAVRPQLEQLQQATFELEVLILQKFEMLNEPRECELLWALLEEWALAQRLQRFVAGVAADVHDRVECELVLKLRMTETIEHCVQRTDIATTKDDSPHSSWAHVELILGS